MINHLEYHCELTKKSNLFINLQTFSEINKENVFNYIPITFYIEVNTTSHNVHLSTVLQNFTCLFLALESNKEQIGMLHAFPEKLLETYKPSKMSKKLKNFGSLTPSDFGNRGIPQYIKYSMPLCHFRGHNLWLLKPTSLNRGRGIHVFNNLATLQELIMSYCQNKSEDAEKKYII